MNNTNESEFSKFILGRLQEIPDAPFEPSVHYDPDGDCVEFIAAPGPFYAERLDELVTVYTSQESGEVVGSLIKQVTRFCKSITEQFPGFNVVIEHGRVRLEHLFLAKLLSIKDLDNVNTIIYRKLFRAAESARLEAEVCS